MKEPQIRLATDKDSAMLIDWMANNSWRNGLEPEILGYPAMQVLVADPMDGQEPWLMAPIHPVYVIDSLAPNPKALPAQLGLSLRKITEIAKWEGQKAGHGQVYFIASEPSIAEFAQKHERFKPVEYGQVFRMKLR